MLIFGTRICLDFIPMNINIENGMIVYNLTSASEDYPSVAIMPPRISPNDDFERVLIDYIYNNDAIFMEWMGKIIMPLYSNMSVFIICNDNQIFDFVTDAVSSIIRNRYGYMSYILNNPDDVFFLSEKINNEGEFGILQMKNLYDDKERYSYLYEMNNGGLSDGSSV